MANPRFVRQVRNKVTRHQWELVPQLERACILQNSIGHPNYEFSPEVNQSTEQRLKRRAELRSESGQWHLHHAERALDDPGVN